MFAERLPEPLKAVLIVHIHATNVGGDAHKIGNKNQQRLRIWRFEIAIESRKLFLLGAAGIELAHVAHKNHLEWSHQRRRLRPVEYFKDRRSIEIQIGETKVLQFRRNKALDDGCAAAVEQERLVARQHITGP